MSESTKFCIQHLDKSGEGFPGPMLVRSYDPEKDRYTWADTTAGQIDWTTTKQPRSSTASSCVLPTPSSSSAGPVAQTKSTTKSCAA
jgi:hypothetical protein